MTPAVEKILEDYDHLTTQEQQAALVEVLKRSKIYPAMPLTDEALTSIADALFQALDAEEAELEKSAAK